MAFWRGSVGAVARGEMSGRGRGAVVLLRRTWRQSIVERSIVRLYHTQRKELVTARALRRMHSTEVKPRWRIALTGGLALPAGSSAEELSCLPEITRCRHRRIFLGPFP